MKDRLSLFVVEFDGLLLVELVEIGVVAVNKNAALGDMRFETGRGVAKGARTRLNDVLERLFGKSLDEGRPLDGPKFRANLAAGTLGSILKQAGLKQ